MIRVQNFKIETDLVPSLAKYSVLYPIDYETSDKIYPLMLFLHGGNGPKGFVNQIKTIVRNLWEKKLAPEMVVVIPHCDRSFYMDYRDDSQKWEIFILNELIPHLQNNFRVSKYIIVSTLGMNSKEIKGLENLVNITMKY